MAKIQQGDVLLFQTENDGEIDICNGVATMTGGLETAAYLALFGGNEDDNGLGENPRQFWGNLSESDPEKKYRSQTQYLLRSIPAISSNLRRIEESAKNDLAFFVKIGTATEVKVAATIPGLNKINLACSVIGDFGTLDFSFSENWTANILNDQGDPTVCDS
jgi:phage gp46-like protein